MNGLLKQLWRLKSIESVTSETSLRRCLGVLDLIVIGVGSMVGSGIYIMTGTAAKTQAGPSVVLSFVISAIVVLLVAVCFIELAARLHKTGSTYLYLYLTVGELPAFVCGFGLLILSVFGAAINARSITFYADSMFKGAIVNFTETHLAVWSIGPPVARFPDVLAVVMVLVISLIVGLGVACSTRFSAVLVVVNILILLFISACAFIFGNFKNWSSAANWDCHSLHNGTCLLENSTRAVTWVEEFMPFGWTGTFMAASSCFWAFSGFEMIACAVEECRTPHHDIPIAMCTTLFLVTLLYVSVAAGLTLLVPWSSIDVDAPLSSAMSAIAGLEWARYLVSAGTLCGFTMALLSNVYGFTRTALVMAEDGLLPVCFAQVNERTRVPVISVVVCGSLSAVIAFMTDVHELVSFAVNLLLISYSAVCVCVVVLRYRPVPRPIGASQSNSDVSHRSNVTLTNDEITSSQLIYLDNPRASPIHVSSNGHSQDDRDPNDKLNLLRISEDASDLKEVYETKMATTPAIRYLRESFRCVEPIVARAGGRCVQIALVLMIFLIVGFALFLVYAETPLERGTWWATFIAVVTALCIVILLAFICIHRQSNNDQALLRIPCVPLIPSVAIMFCLTLLVTNSTMASWIGTGVILLSALIVYLSFSIHHSKLKPRLTAMNEEEQSGSTTHLLTQDSCSDEEDDEEEIAL